MKIALVCSNLGYAYRGFERFNFELFGQLKDELPVTLFGSRLNGASNEVSLPCLKYDRFLKIFAGKKRDNYFFSQLSYALSLIPFIVWHRYDIVHYSEPGIGSFLFHAKKLFGFKYKLIFTDALGLEDKVLYERQDHSQAVTLPHYENMVHAGVSRRKLSFVPYGIDSRVYETKKSKEELRSKYGIPKDKIVILSVAALNRRHKRIDYLINEVSGLSEKYFLLVVGHPEEPDLIQLGEEKLGDNFKSLYVSFKDMPDLYQLANLFVIPSLAEGFCLALVEAMCAGLPVIAHNSAHFNWLTDEPRYLVDLRREGNLSQKITEIAGSYENFLSVAEKNRLKTIQRFDWANLKQDYHHLYERVLSNGN